MINQFIILISNVWSKETAYNQCFEENNPALGQCAVTSLLFQDYFGGDIYKVQYDDINHYFNVLDNEIYDITSSQFDEPISYDNKILKSRDTILSNADTLKRYKILKERYEQECAKLLKINNDVHKCDKCQNKVEKFETSKTIHFGSNKNIVILGEAPANNGWRKSGKVWYDVNNNLLPSGKVMQKLLDEINCQLLDITFLEAIKCYPKDRKYLKACKQNCHNILAKQIELLNPKLILTLGDMATKAILDIKYTKFSEVVGQCYEIKINNKTVKIIPIYHPSPISPMSYKGNLPIFKQLKELC